VAAAPSRPAASPPANVIAMFATAAPAAPLVKSVIVS
jgi:hypothetical protein